MKKTGPLCVLAFSIFLLTSACCFITSISYASGGGGGHGGKSESKGEGEGKQESGTGPFVRLQPMVLPVITEDGAEQIVTFLIVIQVKDSDVIKSIQEQMPRIQDAIFRVLYTGLSDGSLRKGNSINLSKVKIRVTNALGKVIDKSKIDGVLIQAVGQRAL